MWYLWHWTDAEFKEQVWLQAKKKIKKDGMKNIPLNPLTEKAMKLPMDKTVVRKVLKQLFGRSGTEKLS